MTKKLDKDSTCEGTVSEFKSNTCKYTVQYTDGTSAKLTKTALEKVLLAATVTAVSLDTLITVGERKA